jgi:hypothetical protein
LADIVAKAFLGVVITEIFRTANAFRARGYEGPHRLVKKRSRSFVSALWSIARFLASFDFRLLQQYRHEAEHAAHSALQISLVDAPAKPARRRRASGG